jgi:hypothetical protein
MKFVLASPMDLPIFVKKMIRLTFIAFLLINSLSCSTKELKSGQTNLSFFSLIDFMSLEQKEMLKDKTRLIKVLHLNGKRDTLVLDRPNFENELDVFKKADINKPALSDKYAIDSVLQKGQLFKVIYTSKDKKLLTQKLSIQYNALGKVVSIDVQLYNGSPITKNVQHLIYKPTFGYQIIDNQYFMGNKDEVKVEGFFK